MSLLRPVIMLSTRQNATESAATMLAVAFFAALLAKYTSETIIIHLVMLAAPATSSALHLLKNSETSTEKGAQMSNFTGSSSLIRKRNGCG